MEKIIIAQQRQTIFDIAVQELGTVEPFIDIVKANNLTEIPPNIEGEKLIIPPNAKKRDSVIKILNGRTIVSDNQMNISPENKNLNIV